MAMSVKAFKKIQKIQKAEQRAATAANKTTEIVQNTADLAVGGARKLSTIGLDDIKAAPRAAWDGALAAPGVIGRGAVRGGVKGAKKIAKTSLIDSRDANGEIKKTIGNIYTGKRINPIHMGVGGAAVIGGSFMQRQADHHYKMPLELATTNNYQEIGAPDIMNYDGVSQQRAPRNLNANGSLVFGLHNGRKG